MFAHPFFLQNNLCNVVPDAFKRKIAELESQQADKLQQLEVRREKLAAKWHETREDLRLWASAKLYMRELLDLPKPELSLPSFSAPSGPVADTIQSKLQRVSDMANERKQKAPAKTHWRNDRGR